MSSPFAGRFTLVDPIGSGMSGTVWRAFDHRLGGYCAAKVVAPADAGLLLRVVREQSFRLEHRHVSSPYAWVADGDVLIAMELFEGGSLASLIRDHGPLPEAYAAAILGQILEALAHVHSAGLLHRDVKPANVLLEATGLDAPRCLLGDFGLALPTYGPRLTDTGHVVGTPGYLPPEAALGVPPDVRRDLYAAGVTTRLLLIGAEDPPYEVEPAGDGPLWALVDLLTAPDPEARPENAAQALDRLRAVASGLGPAVPARTPDGEPIEVFDLVGPLPPGAPEGPVLREVPRGADPPRRGAPAAAPTPKPEAKPAPVAAPPAPTHPPEPPGGPPVEPKPSPDPVPVAEPIAEPARAPAKKSRVNIRRWSFVVGGVAAAAAALTAAVIAADSDPPSSDTPGRAPANTQAPAKGPSGSPPPVRDVADPCEWYDVGNQVVTPGRARMQCAYQTDGGYRWTTIDAP